MDNQQVRRRINERLRSDADFDAFCLDHFADVRRKFNDRMDRTQRITMLLEEHGADAVAAALQREGDPRPAAFAQPVYFVVGSLSPHFTGRQDTLAVLRQRLPSERIVALWGLGGMGKTQTALAYAERHRDQYPVVLWLPGATPAGFEQGLLEIGSRLAEGGRISSVDARDPAAVRRAVLDYLRRADDYLLLCDSVDEPQLIKPIWPDKSKLRGQVLLTSRSQDCKRLGATVIEMGTLPTPDAKDYLARCHPPKRSSEQQALADLAAELDGLPLALAQAAAFLVEHHSRYADYLQQYRKQCLVLLEQGFPEDYPTSVANTWSISVEQVKRASTASFELLNVCALLHPDAIPEELFAKPVALLGAELHAALTEPPEGDALTLDRVLRPVLNHALLQRDRGSRLLSLHRLVQQALLYQMPSAEQQRRAQAAVAQLDASFPEPDFRNWAKCRRLLPQVAPMVTHIDRFGLHDQAASSLLHKVGRYYYNQAQYAEAEPLHRRALALREKSLGSQHPDVAWSLNYLGVLLRRRGKLDEAEVLLRRAVEIQEKAHGAEHPEIAWSLNNLGMALHDQRKFAEAEPLYRRALMLRETALGSDHRDVAWSLNRLGSLLRDLQRLADAEALHRRALAIQEKVLGGEHPEVAWCLNHLGSVVQDQGRLADAEQLYERALAIREKVLGGEHHDVAWSLHRLASLRREQGLLDDAEKQFRRALALQEKVLAEEHPDVIRSLADLGSLLHDKGVLAEAQPLFERALAVRDKALPAVHPLLAEVSARLERLVAKKDK